MKLKRKKENNLRLQNLYQLILSVALSIFIVYMLDLAFEVSTAPFGTILSEWNRSIPFYEKLDVPSAIELNSKFTIHDKNRKVAVLFPKVLANRMDVYINGRFVTSFGDIGGNLWPRALVCELPNWLLENTNEMKLVLYGTVGYGISYPPFIADSYKIKFRSTIINLLRNDVSLIAIGAAIVIGYMLFFAFLIVDKPDRMLYFYTTFTMIFMILGLIQFVYREASLSTEVYLLFEKFGVILPIFGLIFIYFSLYAYRNVKANLLNYFVFFLPFVVLAILIFSTNYPKRLNLWFQVSELLAFIMVFITLFHVIRYKIKEYYFPAIFLLFTSFQTLYVLLNNLAHEIYLVYGRIVFAIYIGTYTIKRFKYISEEKKFLERENLIDKLTGAYNRKVVELIKPGGVLIILDMDNFKEVNDKYGHLYGDEMLKRFSNIVKSHIRSNEDYFIRLGGDEFAIISRSSEPEKLIRRIYDASKNELGLGFSWGSAVFNDFDEAYAIADKILYEDKKKKL